MTSRYRYGLAQEVCNYKLDVVLFSSFSISFINNKCPETHTILFNQGPEYFVAADGLLTNNGCTSRNATTKSTRGDGLGVKLAIFHCRIYSAPSAGMSLATLGLRGSLCQCDSHLRVIFFGAQRQQPVRACHTCKGSRAK